MNRKESNILTGIHFTLIFILANNVPNNPPTKNLLPTNLLFESFEVKNDFLVFCQSMLRFLSNLSCIYMHVVKEMFNIKGVYE